MSDAITFNTLEKSLERLGFVETTVPGSHVVFEHPGTGAMLLLRPHRPAEKLSPATLIAVRKTLVENGLVEKKAAESFFNGSTA